MFSALYSYVASAEKVLLEKLAPNIKGALCYIQADDQVVFVDELLTKRLSLPGGTIEDNESPKVTAKRETWEETGIIVSVLEELVQTETAVVYHCQPDSGVVAFSAQNAKGYHVLPGWYAPSYGLEVSQVYLANPNYISKKEYRYPEQFKSQVLNHDVNNASVYYIESAVSAAPFYHQIELPKIQLLQSWINELSPMLKHSFLNVIHGLNSSSSFYILLLLLPIIYFFLGANFTVKLNFLMLISFTIVALLQLGLKFPRPYAYDPNLNLGSLSGFGSPSLRSTVAVVWSSYIYHHLTKSYKEFGRYKYLLSLLLIILAQGFSSVALGLNFSSDVVFGYVLGAFIVSNFIRIESLGYTQLPVILGDSKFWWGCFIILVVLSWYTHSLLFGYISAATLGFTMSLVFLKKDKMEGWGGLSIKLPLTWCLILMVSYLYQHTLLSNTYSSSTSYFLQCSAWFAMTFIVFTFGRIKQYTH